MLCFVFMACAAITLVVGTLLGAFFGQKACVLAKKYYWTREEEAKLIELWRKGITDFNVLGIQLGRTLGAVEKKVDRLSLSSALRTTTVSLTEDLLTHEQALKVLSGAVELFRKPDQDMLELQRLRILVDALQTCDSVLEMRARKTILRVHKNRKKRGYFCRYCSIYISFPTKKTADPMARQRSL